MSMENSVNLAFAAFVVVTVLCAGVGIGLGLYFENDVETGMKPAVGNRYKPAFLVMHTFAPIMLGVLLLITEAMGSEAFTTFRSVFLLICLYDCLLLLLIPFLRKTLSAKTCSFLWSLPYAPMYFYLVTLRMIHTPAFVIPLPTDMIRLPNVFLWIWVAGMIAVLLWHMIGHLLFRKHLLQYAHPVDDEEILRLWEKEQYLANMGSHTYALWTSPQTATPLSIGLFRKSTYVVLPDKTYSAESLSLIFRHELIHLCRKDCWNKFLMLFITALFWFNPLMWIAMRCSAEDLELSCDETVLLGHNPQTRKEYAKLVLNSAADQRGFTTCLSASTKALRYRLKNVVAPYKRWKGYTLAGLLFVVLCLGILFGDFSCKPGTVAEIVFENRISEDYVYVDVVLYDGENAKDCTNGNSEAIVKYLSNLQISQLMRNYEDMSLEQGAQINIETQNDRFILWLSDHFLRVRSFQDGKAVQRCFILQEPVNWEPFIAVLNAN